MDKTITTLTSPEFDQAAGRARKAARNGPVFITDRGRPAYVLLAIEDYRAMMREPMTLADALAHPGAADIEFDLPCLRGPLSKPVDFS